MEVKNYRDKNIRKTREFYYIKKQLQRKISLIVLYGILAFVYPDPFFFFMPILRADSCFYRIIELNDRGKDQQGALYKWYMTLNEIIFVIVNWLEIAYLYRTHRKLRKVEHNQLNIKKEMTIAMIMWGSFSVIYFFLFVIGNDFEKDFNDE